MFSLLSGIVNLRDIIMSYYSSRFNTGGVSYYSGIGSSSSRYNSSRPRFRPGSTKPDYSDLWWKYRQYAPDENNNTDKTVIQLDLMKNDNKKAHRTDKYGVSGLIVRRGQGFSLTVEISVPFEKSKDRIQFLLSKGDRPQESKGTLVRIDIYNDQKTAEQEAHGDWYGYISSINGRNVGATVTVVITSPADALVGKYGIKTKVYGSDLNDKRQRFMKDEDEFIYVLFNAWCKDDQVYLDKEAEREEYVLNETGKIWVGSRRSNRGRAWNFGQFSRHSMEAAMYLLNKCTTLTAQGHGNVTLVVRALSAMANSNDNDHGVLSGNWSGNYTGGTSPTQWNGSQAILEEYMLTKRDVKFGQCWVFSGLLTTLGRTLGIPTRSVTNFDSAHDSDFSMTIDTHFSISGKPLSYMDDSVWNFHVWNESWFKRPDLPDGYDGWQVYDATPQEASEGVMRCGPAPLRAIKEGNVYLNYDCKFVFAEVNGDRVTWIVLSSGNMFAMKSRTETDTVGNVISTKQVGAGERLDITDLYKYKEGSKEEREVVARASQYSSRATKLVKIYKETSDLLFIYNSDTKENGDVSVSLEVRNTSPDIRNVTLFVTATAAYYTGISGEELSHDKMEFTVQAGDKTTKNWLLEAKNYFNIIDEDAKLKVYMMAMVNQTNQIFTKSEMFELDKPDLSLQLSKQKVSVGQSFDVTIKFRNPLDMKLTEGVIRLEGPGIQKNQKIPLHRSIGAKEEFSETVQLTPKYSGKREVIACFNSRQLTDIHGSVSVEVA